LSPEEQQIRMPLLTPLFSNDSEEGDALHPLFTFSSGGTKITRFLGGAVEQVPNTRTLGELEVLYGEYGLTKAVKIHLEHDNPEYRRAKIKLEELDDLFIQIRTFVKICCETVQAIEPIETLKATCSGPRRINDSIRNDCIIYLEEESADEFSSDDENDPQFLQTGKKATRKRSISRFGPNQFGKLKCLFKLEVPKPEFWEDFRVARGNTLS